MHHILYRDTAVQAALYFLIYSIQMFPVNDLQGHSNILLDIKKIVVLLNKCLLGLLQFNCILICFMEALSASSSWAIFCSLNLSTDSPNEVPYLLIT